MSIIETLKKTSIFNYLTDEQLHDLSNIVKKIVIESDKVLFRKGDVSDIIYFIISGIVKVYEQDENGNEHIFTNLSDGDFFGEMTIFDGKSRSADVATITECEFLILTREDFIALTFSSLPFASNIFTGLTNKIRSSNEKIINEITEKQKIQSEIEIEKHRSISMMVAGVAHEINTPLGIVNTAASYISELLTPDVINSLAKDEDSQDVLSDVLDAVKLMQNNIRRANKLIQNFKKISINQINDKIDEVKLFDEVNSNIDLFKINMLQKKLEIISTSDIKIDNWTGYPGYLSQVIINILSNIERYAYPENLGGKIEVNLSEKNNIKEPLFVITIRDFGVGISAEDLPKIFNAFFTTGHSKGGTGLGLALVHNLVTNGLKGKIDIQSELGKGTTVTIIFPQVIYE
ncbi:MAG: cyclic nucleotide-binding domain-containing protein [Cyanobacteriota bacterium]